MNRINYQKQLDQTIEQLIAEGKVPALLLHSCCAPCSSYVLEYLSEYFAITVYYYNPNIYPPEEFDHRAEEQKRFIGQFPTKHPVQFIEGAFEDERFYALAKGLEKEPERGARCMKCYELRLRETAGLAAKNGFDFFTTTLSISPMKDAEALNTIGGRLAKEYGVAYLYSDFKKKNGYLRSTEISKEYGIYRQDYCGCVYSLRDRAKQETLKREERR